MKLIHPAHEQLRIERSVRRLLERTELCSIATRGPEGGAHIHTAFFAFDAELRLYFLSDPGSRHARNLATAPASAVTVFDTRQRWGDDNAGLQLFGAGSRAAGDARTRAEAVYAERFPRYAEFAARGGELAQFHRLRFFAIEVARLTLLDEAEFGPAVLIEAQVARDSGATDRS